MVVRIGFRALEESHPRPEILFDRNLYNNTPIHVRSYAKLMQDHAVNLSRHSKHLGVTLALACVTRVVMKFR